MLRAACYMKKMNKKILIIAVMILAIAFGGIVYWYKSPKEEKSEGKFGAGEKWGIGLLAPSEDSLERHQAFAEYLSKYADHEWHIVYIKDYPSFITQFKLKQIRAGFIGSALGYQLIKEGSALPVARGEKGGVSTYNGYLFTRKDGGLNKIEDLQGKRFAYVDPYTSAGYLFPRYLLKSKGYDQDEFFRVASFLGSHDKAIQAVLDGSFDGGAAKDMVWNKMAKENPRIESELQILAKEGPFPDDTFMISADFGGEEVDELRELMLEISDKPDGKDYLTRIGIDRFIITENKDFDNVKRISDVFSFLINKLSVK